MAIRKCVVAVPARLQSSRLPNKVLADIGGQPMIQRVLERCRQARSVEAVVLCTDSTELQTIGGIVSGKSDQGILQFSKDCLLSNC